MTNKVGVVTAKKQPLLPRWLKFLLMLLGFLVAVAVLLWVIADISSRDSLEAEIEQLRAKGWPTTLEELKASPIPASENAALIYEQAFAQHKMLDWAGQEFLGKLEEPEVHGTIDEEGLAYLQAHLEENEEVLELLHQAAQMPECHFDLLRPPPVWTAMSLLSKSRAMTRLAVFATRVAIARGRGAAALRYWQDSMAVSHALADHQVIVAELVGFACVSISLRALESLLQSDFLNEAQLQQALATLDALQGRGSLASAMQGELAVVIASFNTRQIVPFGTAAAKRASGQPLTWMDRLANVGNWGYRTWLFRPLHRYDQLYLLRFQGRLTPLCNERFDTVRAQREQLGKKAAQVPRYLPFSSWRCANFLKILEAQAAHEARVASARAAVAVEIYRKRHGEYPDTLDALVPSILPEAPIDPFDGQPMRYIKEDGRVAVYSVGKNLRDDGGSAEPDTYGYPPDIVFTLRRASTPTEESDDE